MRGPGPGSRARRVQPGRPAVPPAALTPRPAPAGLGSDRAPSLRVARSGSQQWRRRRRAGPGRGRRAIGLPPPARRLPSCRSRGLIERGECVRVAAAALTQRAQRPHKGARAGRSGERSPGDPAVAGTWGRGDRAGVGSRPRWEAPSGGRAPTGLEAGDGEGAGGQGRCGLRNPGAAARARGNWKSGAWGGGWNAKDGAVPKSRGKGAPSHPHLAVEPIWSPEEWGRVRRGGLPEAVEGGREGESSSRAWPGAGEGVSLVEGGTDGNRGGSAGRGELFGGAGCGGRSPSWGGGPDLGGRPGQLDGRKFRAKRARCVPRRRVSLVRIGRESSGRSKQRSLPPGRRKGSSWKEGGGF